MGIVSRSWKCTKSIAWAMIVGPVAWFLVAMTFIIGREVYMNVKEPKIPSMQTMAPLFGHYPPQAPPPMPR